MTLIDTLAPLLLTVVIAVLFFVIARIFVRVKGGKCNCFKPLGENECIVITGGNTGMGFVTSLKLAEAGGLFCPTHRFHFLQLLS